VKRKTTVLLNFHTIKENGRPYSALLRREKSNTTQNSISSNKNQGLKEKKGNKKEDAKAYNARQNLRRFLIRGKGVASWSDARQLTV